MSYEIIPQAPNYEMNGINHTTPNNHSPKAHAVRPT